MIKYVIRYVTDLVPKEFAKLDAIFFCQFFRCSVSDSVLESNADLYRNVLPEKFQWTGEDYPCLKGAFNDILIVITYNSPFYDNIDIINRLYGSVFGRVVHCGIAGAEKLQPDIIADVAGGHRGYVCMARAIEKYPDFQGNIS